MDAAVPLKNSKKIFPKSPDLRPDDDVKKICGNLVKYVDPELRMCDDGEWWRIKSFHLPLPSYVSINSSAPRTHYTHGYKCKIGLNTNIKRESNTNTKRESNTNTKTMWGLNLSIFHSRPLCQLIVERAQYKYKKYKKMQNEDQIQMQNKIFPSSRSTSQLTTLYCTEKVFSQGGLQLSFSKSR